MVSNKLFRGAHLEHSFWSDFRIKIRPRSFICILDKILVFCANNLDFYSLATLAEILWGAA